MKLYLELVVGIFDLLFLVFDDMFLVGLFIFLGCVGVFFFFVINFKRII